MATIYQEKDSVIQIWPHVAPKKQNFEMVAHSSTSDPIDWSKVPPPLVTVAKLDQLDIKMVEPALLDLFLGVKLQEVDSKDYSTQWKDSFTLLSFMNKTKPSHFIHVSFSESHKGYHKYTKSSVHPPQF